MLEALAAAGRGDNLDDLHDFEALVHTVEELQAQLSAKEEQQNFLAEVIADKQKLCQQVKDQHDEKVRALARQSRRQRARKGGRTGALSAPGSTVGYENLLPPPVVREDEEEDEEEEPATTPPSAEPAAASPPPAIAAIEAAGLDVRMLEQAVGGEEALRRALGDGAGLAGFGGAGGEGGADDGAGGGDGPHHRLPALRRALEERLSGLRGLNARVAEAASRLREQAANGAGQDAAGLPRAATAAAETTMPPSDAELDALRLEVATALGTAGAAAPPPLAPLARPPLGPAP